MWLKRAKYILTGLGLLSFLIVSLAVAIAVLYEQEIKQQAIIELNNHLKSKVQVDNIELTALDQFPNIALKFNNIYIEDKTVQNDTLFFSKKLYLNFDLIDILRGDYAVKKIVFNSSTIKLNVDAKGIENYDIWKSNSQEKEKVHFSLEKVIFQDLSLSYANSLNQQDYVFFSEDLFLKGDFFKANYMLSVNGNLSVLNFKSNAITYLKNKTAVLELNLQINTQNQQYKFSKSSLYIEGMPFLISGSYNAKETALVNLNIRGNNIQIDQAFSVFPIDVLAVLETYNARGVLEFDAAIIGELSNEKTPFFSANFAIQNGAIKEVDTGTELTSIFLTGDYSGKNKKEKEKLSLSNFEALLAGEKCKGNFEITNFNAPNFLGSFKAVFALEALSNFISLDFGKLSGKAKTNLSFNVKKKLSSSQYLVSAIDGYIDFNDVFLINAKNNISIENLGANFKVENNELVGSKIEGIFNGSPFQSDLRLKNFKDIITMKSTKPKIEGNLKLDELNLTSFLAEKSNDTDSISSFEFIDLLLAVNLKKLHYQSFTAKKVKGLLFVENGSVEFNNVSFLANKGTYLFDANFLSNQDKGYLLDLKGRASKVSIASFFKEFDNFGQTYITDAHLKGKSSIDLSLRIPFNDKMEIDKNNIQSTAQLHIKNGQLINHESILAIAEYLNESRLAKTFLDIDKISKNLAHIYFSELNNSINISNGKIAIPKMGIKSNVLDFNISGVHYFNDSIDYNLSFRLRDVLKKKKDKIADLDIEDDQTGKILYLKMYGTTDDPQFELDKKGRKQEKKILVESEKTEVKSLLNQEFGLFSSDTSLKETSSRDTTVFELEWEESELPEIDSNSKGNPKKKKKEKKLNKWLKKMGVEEEKEEEVIFEIDQ